MKHMVEKGFFDVAFSLSPLVDINIVLSLGILTFLMFLYCQSTYRYRSVSIILFKTKSTERIEGPYLSSFYVYRQDIFFLNYSYMFITIIYHANIF